MAAARLKEQPALLCVGESFTDLIFLGLDRIPAAGEELRTQNFVATVGGGAVITAVAASRLGVRARVISALGPDAVARLRNEHVGFINVIRPGEPPAVSVAISTHRDRSFVTFDGVNARLERRLLARVGDSASVKRAALVHFALAPGKCTPWITLVHRLRAAGIITSWDFGWHQRLATRRGFQALARAVDYLFLNEQETLMYARARTIARAVEWWRRARGHTVIKLGARGSRWIGPRFDISARAVRVRALETTGAGDAFNGGFLAGLARGLSPLATLRLANRTGAAATRRAGGLP